MNDMSLTISLMVSCVALLAEMTNLHNETHDQMQVFCDQFQILSNFNDNLLISECVCVHVLMARCNVVTHVLT